MVSKEEILEFKTEYNSLDSEDFSGIFQLIIKIVRRIKDKSRPGIMLGLVELGYNRGNFVGGFHRLGTNEVYLNKSALRVMREETSEDLYKAYLFHLLLHEYIHSNNFVDETETRQLTKNISLAIFGESHPVGKLTIFGLGAFFPYTFRENRFMPTREEMVNPEYILLRHPDSEFTYI
ncbi:MAG: hypothetical protein ACXADY_12510 [Candidatus Hodarchaeales archaeon]|jgi:hypothetical protein